MFFTRPVKFTYTVSPTAISYTLTETDVSPPPLPVATLDTTPPLTDTLPSTSSMSAGNRSPTTTSYADDCEVPSTCEIAIVYCTKSPASADEGVTAFVACRRGSTISNGRRSVLTLPLNVWTAETVKPPPSTLRGSLFATTNVISTVISSSSVRMLSAAFVVGPKANSTWS